VISCIVPYSGQERALLRVTVQSALDAGINEIVVVNDADGEMPVTRSRVLVVAGPRDGYLAALAVGVDAARYSWICVLEPGEAVLPARLQQLALTVAGGHAAPHSEWVDVDTANVRSSGAMAGALFHRDTIDSLEGPLHWAFFPHATAIAGSDARAIGFSTLSAVSDGNRDDSPHRVVEQLNV
jgi:hypothetical protein